jgi:cellulose synthase/poly-beta-1,6-N-acetylglucosamine synthase-like glycosyltransferase
MFLLIWGVWILLPIAVDGVDTVVRLFVVLIWGRTKTGLDFPDEELPNITILVPAYNEEQVIDRCLNSIKLQDYPHEKMEVIVINDGSSDLTADKVMEHIDGGDSAARDLYKYMGKEDMRHDGGGHMPGSLVPPGVYRSKYLRHDGNGHGNGNGNGNGKDAILVNGKHTDVPEFGGDISLVNNHHYGKPVALNSGIAAMNGSQIIFTVDSDVVLAPDAVRQMVNAFLDDPNLGAATGHIEIAEEIVEERDDLGNLMLDADGKLMIKKLNFWQKALTRLQFLEYLDAVRLGRQFQSTIGSAYILAGAFSAFRRTTLMKTALYKPRTVSEDFDLTVDIHKTGEKVGYVPTSKALLEPIIKADNLYAQRVRWCRGQLEVSGAHQDMIGNRKYGVVGWFGFPQMLIVDHTLSFPRLIWTILICLFPFFGYPVSTVVIALALTYGFYVFLSLTQTAAAYTLVDSDTKRKTERALAWCFILPIYRLVVFYFRMSGYLRTLKEPAQWTAGSAALANSSRNFETFKMMATSILGMFSVTLAHDGNGHKPRLHVRYRRAARSIRAFLRHRFAHDGSGLDGDGFGLGE